MQIKHPPWDEKSMIFFLTNNSPIVSEWVTNEMLIWTHQYVSAVFMPTEE